MSTSDAPRTSVAGEKKTGGFRLLDAVREAKGPAFRPLDAVASATPAEFTALKTAEGVPAVPRLRLLVRDADEEAAREAAARAAREKVERDRLAALEKKARDKGFADGAAKAAGIFRDALAGIEDYKARVLLGCRDEIIELALAVAERIVRRELATSRETAIATLWDAIRMATETEGIRVRVAQQDLDAVEAAVAGYHAELGTLKGVVVEADPAVAPGGCIVETAHGTIDARVERQFEEIAGELRESA